MARSCVICSSETATFTGAAVCQRCREAAGGALMERIDALAMERPSYERLKDWEIEHAAAWRELREAVKADAY